MDMTFIQTIGFLAMFATLVSIVILLGRTAYLLSLTGSESDRCQKDNATLSRCTILGILPLILLFDVLAMYSVLSTYNVNGLHRIVGLGMFNVALLSTCLALWLKSKNKRKQVMKLSIVFTLTAYILFIVLTIIPY